MEETLARYEIAIRTGLAFLSGSGLDPTVCDQIIFDFRNRAFVWHAHARPDPELGPTLPTLTVMVEEPRDTRPEALLTHRCLSALAFCFDEAVEPIFSAVSRRGPFDRAFARQTGAWHYAESGHTAFSELVARDDEHLDLAMALYREGRASESPFYRFLAYWNALDVVFDNDGAQRNKFIRAAPEQFPSWFTYVPERPADWAEYFKGSSRNAVAHAIRPQVKPVLDPDHPEDRQRLKSDSDVLGRMVRHKVKEHWPYPVYTR